MTEASATQLDSSRSDEDVRVLAAEDGEEVGHVKGHVTALATARKAYDDEDDLVICGDIHNPNGCFRVFPAGTSRLSLQASGPNLMRAMKRETASS